MFQVWDLATDKVGWVGAACRATMIGHMHTVRCLQVYVHLIHTVSEAPGVHNAQAQVDYHIAGNFGEVFYLARW